MQKEILIVIVIVIIIISADVLTQKYTADSFTDINNQLDEVRIIGKELEEIEKLENNSLESQEKKKELEEKIDNMQDDWRKINKRTAFYIEHDELEKVTTELTKLKADVETENYEFAIENLDNCIFILENIKDKSALKIVNIF